MIMHPYHHFCKMSLLLCTYYMYLLADNRIEVIVYQAKNPYVLILALLPTIIATTMSSRLFWIIKVGVA